jgi:hypothetical protein
MGNKSSTVKEFPDPPSFITDIVNCIRHSALPLAFL